MKEKKERVGLRLKSLENQEVKVKEKLKESQENLQKSLEEKDKKTAS